MSSGPSPYTLLVLTRRHAWASKNFVAATTKLRLSSSFGIPTKVP